VQRVLCVCLNPAVQRTMQFQGLRQGQVNRAIKVETHVGGKGVNVARVLKQLGVENVVLCFLGGKTGEIVKEKLRQQQIPLQYVEVGSPTRICTTLLDVENHIQTELVEEGTPVTKAEIEAIDRLFAKLLPQVNMVTISGTVPPGVPETLYAEWVTLAHKQNVPTIVDAPGQLMLKCLTAHPLLLKPNWQELERTLGESFSSPKDLKSVLQNLITQHQDRTLGWVVSQGEKGVYVLTKDESYRFVPPSVPVKNPIGSGDAMAAGITTALLRGESMRQAIRYGVACGTANVLTPLVGQIEPEDVQTLYPQIQEIPF